ncbi:TMEM43 family protein [Vibrio bathopelagicus]|uniref:TMEM43 family protein n=1 Tax=Vibrio bathopelagicus TaxID=2777577 RepID=UPI00186518F0|nr:TMEM43 family protein [Vibrio bathopelagicus]
MTDHDSSNNVDPSFETNENTYSESQYYDGEGQEYSVVKERTWSQRVKASISDLGFGVFLISLALFALYANEHRSDHREKVLKQGQKAAISIASDQRDWNNNRKLVHTYGLASTEDILVDSEFGIKAVGIHLKRRVQVYQWKESRRTHIQKLSDGTEKEVTTYTYRKVWSERLNDSTIFKQKQYRNPESVAFKTTVYNAENMRFGGFEFPYELSRMMSRYVEIEADSDLLLGEQAYGHVSKDQKGYYIGNDPDTPSIGDMKITFHIVEPAVVSIVAQQIEDGFRAWNTKSGPLSLLQYGVKTKDEMFEKAHRENTFATWALRFGGFAFMWAGFFLLLRPIAVVASVIPVIGAVIGGGVTLISFSLAALGTLITIIIV